MKYFSRGLFCDMKISMTSREENKTKKQTADQKASGNLKCSKELVNLNQGMWCLAFRIKKGQRISVKT